MAKSRHKEPYDPVIDGDCTITDPKAIKKFKKMLAGPSSMTQKEKTEAYARFQEMNRRADEIIDEWMKGWMKDWM